MSIYKKIIKFSLVLILLSFQSLAVNSKTIPSSFADLAEKLMPSVVNISTTQTIKTSANSLPFQFPPGSPFEDMFKEFNKPTERKATALGSGFIINKKGLIIYMVCSFLKIETINQIQKFLLKNKNFSINKFELKNDDYNLIDKNGFINTLPKEYKDYNIDGFFAAKLIRND